MCGRGLSYHRSFKPPQESGKRTRESAMGDKAQKKKHKTVSALGGEVLRDAQEVAAIEAHWKDIDQGGLPSKPPKKYKYIDELARLQFELIKLQEWVRIE